MKSYQTRLLIIIILIITNAIITIGAPMQYRKYSIRNGLSNTSVKAIYQDSTGYIWLGTKDGLNRFDGTEIKTYYNVNNKNERISNDIVSITGDNKGRIWIGTFNGISLFDTHKEQFIKIDSIYKGERPRGVTVGTWISPNKSIWIATKVGIYIFTENECICPSKFKGMHINSMIAVKDSIILLNIVKKGIFAINTKTLNLSKVNGVYDHNKYYKIFNDGKGNTWITSDMYNMYIYDNKNNKLNKIKIDIPISIIDDYSKWQIHDLKAYGTSKILLSTDNGLWVYDKKNKNITRNIENWIFSKDFTNNRLMSLYEDNQGGLWAGTYDEGVLYYHPNLSLFKLHEIKSEEKQNLRINGQLIHYNNKLYVATNDGIHSFIIKEGHIEKISKENKWLKGENVYYLFLNNNQILLYILNKGLFSLDIHTNKITRFIPSLSPERQIRAIAKDSLGGLWIAEDELSRYSDESKALNRSFTTNYDGDTRFMLTQDLLAYGSSMLVGSRTSGIWKFEYQKYALPEYFKGAHKEFDYLGDKNVSTLYLDNKGYLWIGTFDSGIYRYCPKDNSVKHFNTEKRLAHNLVCAILEDRKTGDIWVSTATGISKITYPQLNVLSYDENSGFPISEVTTKTLVQLDNKNICVGGNNGLVEFNPESLNNLKRETSPETQITSISSYASKNWMNQVKFDNVESLSNVNLSYDNATIIIKYSVLDYVFPHAYNFAYLMDGLDTDWLYSNKNECSYSHLPAGNYKFRIKSCGIDGVWGKETIIPITVYPPIWLTLWAKIAYAIIIFTLIVSILTYTYKLKTKKYKQRIKDIEEENRERNNRMKQELFTNFSHELRTPLTLISGPVEDILNDKELPNKFIYPMRLIHKNANRLLLLVNQLMTIRKLDYGMIHLELSQIDLPTFLIEQINSFDGLLKKMNIQIVYKNDFHGNNLWVDCDLLEKLIFNLMSNAIKHSKPNSKICINSYKENDNIIISVKDFGDGISKENIDKIFDLFYQVEKSDKAEFYGSGVGLAIVQYVVKLHNGHIRVESDPGKGTEFFISLPLGNKHFEGQNVKYINKQNENSPMHILQECIEPIQAEIYPTKKTTEIIPRLLLVEDDNDMSQYISSLLKNKYNITTARNGKEAFDIAITKIPDIIVSDVMMPIMDGVELCRAIKSELSTAHIPIVLLTARVLTEHVVEGYEAMADDYILKPFSSNVLLYKLDSILKNREKLKQIFSKNIETLEVPLSEIKIEEIFLKQVIDFIKNNINNPELSVSDLCNEFGMSRSLFFQKMKAVSDISPNKLIQSIRMKTAIEMLKKGERSITEIAYSVGYSDSSYFSKVFRATYGVPPSNYINQL